MPPNQPASWFHATRRHFADHGPRGEVPQPQAHSAPGASMLSRGFREIMSQADSVLPLPPLLLFFGPILNVVFLLPGAPGLYRRGGVFVWRQVSQLSGEGGRARGLLVYSSETSHGEGKGQNGKYILYLRREMKRREENKSLLNNIRRERRSGGLLIRLCEYLCGRICAHAYQHDMRCFATRRLRRVTRHLSCSGMLE